jgi:hypothetical protein
MRPLPRAVHLATAVLLLNMLVAAIHVPEWVPMLLFAAAPVLMGWLVWSVLHDRSVSMRDLPDGVEWGYQDREDLHGSR